MQPFSFETYPLPEHEATLNELADGINQVTSADSAIQSALQQHIATQLTAVEKDANAIDSTLKRSINRQMSAIDKGEQQVVQPLAQHISNESSEIGVQTNTIAQMMPAPTLVGPSSSNMAMPLSTATPQFNIGNANSLVCLQQSYNTQRGDSGTYRVYPYLDCFTPTIVIADDSNRYMYDGNDRYVALPPSNETPINVRNILMGQLQQLVMQYCLPKKQQQQQQQSLDEILRQQRILQEQLNNSEQQLAQWDTLSQQQQQQQQAYYDNLRQQYLNNLKLVEDNANQLKQLQQQHGIDYTQIDQVLQQNALKKQQVLQQILQRQSQQDQTTQDHTAALQQLDDAAKQQGWTADQLNNARLELEQQYHKQQYDSQQTQQQQQETANPADITTEANKLTDVFNQLNSGKAVDFNSIYATITNVFNYAAALQRQLATAGQDHTNADNLLSAAKQARDQATALQDARAKQQQQQGGQGGQGGANGAQHDTSGGGMPSGTMGGLPIVTACPPGSASTGNQGGYSYCQDTRTGLYVAVMSASSPPPPPPPPLPPPPPPITYVPQPAALGKPVCGQLYLSFAPPGSEEWCRIQNDILSGIRSLGIALLDWSDGKLAALEQWGDSLEGDLPADCGFTNIFKCIKGGIEYAAGWLTSNAAYGLRYMICLLRNGLKVSGNVDTVSYTAIMAVKVVWYYVKNAEIGSEVWVGVVSKLDRVQISLIDETIDYLLNLCVPMECPGIHDAVSAYMNAEITRERYECWLRLHGMMPETFEPVMRSEREQPTTQEWIEWGRRNDLTVEQIRTKLRGIGWLDDEEAKVQQELFDELPTIADHLHWLQRNVFDDAYVTDFDLLNGFEERFWVKFGHDLRAQGMKKEYAALHYAAHWINPSPGQLFEMVRRLRPGRVPNGISFTEENLLRILAEQDVAPYFRERLRAIAYTPFGLRFLRQLFDTHQITDEEAVERFMDLGYNRDDATILMQSERIRRVRTTTTATKGPTPTKMRQLYLKGQYTREAVIHNMNNLGYSGQVVTDALAVWDVEAKLAQKEEGRNEATKALRHAILHGLQVGTISADAAIQQLVQTGYSANSAKILVSSMQAEAAISVTKQAVSVVRKAALAGRIALDEAAAMLASIGIVAEKIPQYTSIWRMELEAGRKTLTASQIIKKACDGLISIDVARQRLLNLNYTDVDAMLLTADIQQCMAKNEDRVSKLQNRQDEAASKKLLAQQKQLAAQQKKVQAALKASASETTLQRWYVEGLLTAQQLIDRLIAIGVSAVDAGAYVEEGNQKREQINAKKASAQSKASSGVKQPGG